MLMIKSGAGKWHILNETDAHKTDSRSLNFSKALVKDEPTRQANLIDLNPFIK
jgi:hypothetical protein